MTTGILIFGSPLDEHVKAVVSALERQDAPVLVIDRCDPVSLRFGQPVDLYGGVLGEFVARCTSLVIWRRLKPPIADMNAMFEGEPQKRRFWMHQWEDITEATIFLLATDLPSYVINAGNAHVGRRSKAVQLRLAREVGFRVPATAITNCVDDVARLPGNEVLFKVLKQTPYDDRQGVVPVAKLTKIELMDAADSVRRDPSIFQQYVEKRYELRVNVVGDAAVAVKIDSQAFTLSSLDWRRAIAKRDMYETAELPPAVREKLQRFMSLSQLDIGAFDLIVDGDEEDPVFLECNPAGQWMWLDMFVDARISEAVAGLLASKASDLSAAPYPNARSAYAV